MICERCGEELPETSTICPTCGTPQRQGSKRQHTVYGKSSHGHSGEPSSNKQTNPGAYTSYMPPQMYEKAAHKTFSQGPSFVPPILYQIPSPAPTRLAPVQTPATNNALTIEIALSLIGIFGIGWLIAGQTAIGVLFLLGSILFYWPMIIASTILTDGFSLLCLVPIAIGLIIFNAVLLNSYMKHKTQ